MTGLPSDSLPTAWREAPGASPTPFSTVWIQAHGHAQLFGWVTSFMLGTCLYAFPKFCGRLLRSLAVGWLMFVM